MGFGEMLMFLEALLHSAVGVEYDDLLHSSSQCCGTLRSLAWAFPTSSGELLLAMHIMAAVKESHVSCINVLGC